MSDQLRYLPQAEGHVSPFGQAVDRMRVTADAADGLLTAELNGWYDVRVHVSDQAVREMSDDVLQQRLEGLARLLFANRTREYYRLMEVHLQPNPTTLRRMRDDLETTTEDRMVQGVAAGGAVEVGSVGMRHFVVRLEPGIAIELGGEGLSRALTDAAGSMVEAWRGVLADYKRERWS